MPFNKNIIKLNITNTMSQDFISLLITTLHLVMTIHCVNLFSSSCISLCFYVCQTVFVCNNKVLNEEDNLLLLKKTNLRMLNIIHKYT